MRGAQKTKHCDPGKVLAVSNRRFVSCRKSAAELYEPRAYRLSEFILEINQLFCMKNFCR